MKTHADPKTQTPSRTPATPLPNALTHQAQLRNALLRAGVQPRLEIGAVNDPLEREADATAERVMPMPSQAAQANLVQTKASPTSTTQLSPQLESSLNSLNSGGTPLDATTRAFFEPRFGQDFSQARLHTDANAAQMAESLNAKAFTLGKDIAFGANQYSANTTKGRGLLGHELAHVVQQTAVVSPRVQRVVEMRPPGRGEFSAFDRRQELIDRMNALTEGVTYSLSKQQRISFEITDSSSLTPFDHQMLGFIVRDEIVPLRLVTSDGRALNSRGVLENIFIDTFQQGYLDFNDMEASDNDSFKMNMIHLLEERFATRDYERRIGTFSSISEFQRAHARGLQAETQYLRDTIGDPTIRFDSKTETTTILVFKFSSDEGYHIFHEFIGKDQPICGGYVHVRTADGKYITIGDLIVERSKSQEPSGDEDKNRQVEELSNNLNLNSYSPELDLCSKEFLLFRDNLKKAIKARPQDQRETEPQSRENFPLKLCVASSCTPEGDRSSKLGAEMKFFNLTAKDNSVSAQLGATLRFSFDTLHLEVGTAHWGYKIDGKMYPTLNGVLLSNLSTKTPTSYGSLALQKGIFGMKVVWDEPIKLSANVGIKPGRLSFDAKGSLDLDTLSASLEASVGFKPNEAWSLSAKGGLDIPSKKPSVGATLSYSPTKEASITVRLNYNPKQQTSPIDQAKKGPGERDTGVFIEFKFIVQP